MILFLLCLLFLKNPTLIAHVKSLHMLTKSSLLSLNELLSLSAGVAESEKVVFGFVLHLEDIKRKRNHSSSNTGGVIDGNHNGDDLDHNLKAAIDIRDEKRNNLLVMLNSQEFCVDEVENALASLSLCVKEIAPLLNSIGLDVNVAENNTMRVFECLLDQNLIHEEGVICYNKINYLLLFSIYVSFFQLN